jgi:hypothetical protein
MVSITFETRGVKGAEMFLRDFITNIDKELGKTLQPFADLTVANMQRDSPVDTGYMRSQIKRHFPNFTTASINSWAPYSGFVNFGTFRMVGRPFFTKHVEEAPRILNRIHREAIINYLRLLHSRYQNI